MVSQHERLALCLVSFPRCQRKHYRAFLWLVIRDLSQSAWFACHDKLTMDGRFFAQLFFFCRKQLGSRHLYLPSGLSWHTNLALVLESHSVVTGLHLYYTALLMRCTNQLCRSSRLRSQHCISNLNVLGEMGGDDLARGWLHVTEIFQSTNSTLNCGWK